MDPLLLEFCNALLRWTHVITAIAWIGSSFYFMHLDASLKPVADIPTGKGGATWEVHGGGFYEVKKYLEAPAHLPQELIWHKWQSYSTWITGFFLLVWVYYAQAQLFLIDPAVMPLSVWQASALGLAALALGWLFYDALCKSPLAKNEIALGAVLFIFLVLLTYGLQHIFSGRGVLIHIGAVMATIMTANVFFIIIPGQKKIIAALTAGQTPDPALGKRAKIRSTHNNYLTLPVVFLMISNHYPMFYGTSLIWVEVGLLLVAGALVRHFYNVSHSGKGQPWWTWAVAALCMWLVFWIASTSTPLGRERLGLGSLSEKPYAGDMQKAPTHVADIIMGRCAMCHAAAPVWDGIAIAPKGVRLDTPEDVERQKEAIRIHAVLSRAMPPNNITEMTLDERRLVAEWTGTR
ncbi:urate hydroxylase PuuD [Rhizobiales bacterium TNE-4]|nr:urate hydroxylase PuuD [Rhizobiales bacterium TNE-4]MBV1828987.1 urate hydroxylase PuuD [Rhizobiales bacterium TNE-4]